ncbi:protein of unknown function [Streptomyces sp. KY75]|nr:protein of unknown function [Streptomyces sp. KY70]CAD5987029.1 protein of unknown function [Streptomyces sp. KY75]
MRPYVLTYVRAHRPFIREPSL